MPVGRDAYLGVPVRSSLFVVNLYQSDAGLIVFPANDRGVGAGSEADRDGGLEVVRRSESVTGNQPGLVRVCRQVRRDCGQRYPG